MLPTNVMSFMKKMVATDPGGTTETPDGGTTFGKLKQTLSSSLLTAQDKVVKMTPRPSLIPDVTADNDANTDENVQQQATPQLPTKPATPPTTVTEDGQIVRLGCRICLKAVKDDEFHKKCAQCSNKICEDCASYSKVKEDEVDGLWYCSVCRRKKNDMEKKLPQQDSTDSSLDVPLVELQRRHSEIRLGGGLNTGLGSGLAPPRSPELRRHSDVSPASLKELEKLKGAGQKSGDSEWRRGGRSGAPSRQNSPPREAAIREATRSRRASRAIARQHSYDDDVKQAAQPAQESTGLGLPAPMPRRASAYDVFTVLPLSTVTPTSGRRASFRAPPAAPAAPEKSSPPSPEKPAPTALILPEEDRRTRRRGSQLPDIAALRTTPRPTATPALEDLEPAPRRQASIDAEAIRIVIHDVDSGPAASAQRRIILRRDPTDKAHRTRGFGMRVVGGKPSSDGRLYSYVVWTVPSGPAEKVGLQQGDKVLEWAGVSLIDRSFEEVCAIMDRTGDVVELLVEHATDMRICDLLDEPPPPNAINRKPSDAAIAALHVEPDSDKTPSSPTRRKLPKTPV